MPEKDGLQQQKTENDLWNPWNKKSHRIHVSYIYCTSLFTIKNHLNLGKYAVHADPMDL